MNNEILSLMQDFIMIVKHEHDENLELQRACEQLNDAIERELTIAGKN